MTHTPADLSFYMPAEWEKHEGTWLQWPHDKTFENHQIRLEYIWLAMTAALHEHETVHIAVVDERARDHLAHMIVFYGFDSKNIDIQIIPTDDVWSRDNGPIFVVNQGGELGVTDWNFNGWGERYPYKIDRTVPEKVADLLSVPHFRAPVTLEGGGIEVNGSGTLIATRTSILNPNRNPGVSQEEVEAAMLGYLGIRNVIWLSGAPREFCDAYGDDTDYHVDGAARFTDPTTVLYSWTDEESNPEYPYLKQHLKELQEARTESGERLTLAPIPVPDHGIYSTINIRTRPPFEPVPAVGVYANFYIANGVVLVPLYGCKQDSDAKDIIAEHFPDHEIIGIPAQVLAELGGMMHCVTQQQPFV